MVVAPKDNAYDINSEAQDAFLLSMRAHGYSIEGKLIVDGKLHRYHVVGDRSRTKNLWAILYIDERPAGMYGSWKTGERISWTMAGGRKLTEKERVDMRADAQRKATQRKIDDAVRHHAAAQRAQEMIQAGAPVTTHPYLEAKGVQASEHLRVGAWHRVDEKTGKNHLASNCALLVKMRDVQDKIHSVQAIIEDEREPSGFRKQYLSGGAVTGHYFTIGQPVEKIVLICEGLATGLSLHECTGYAVLVAFDASNVEPVARAFYKAAPHFQIVICADNDAWTLKGPLNNPGIHYATKAAKAINGCLAIPQFVRTETKPTDFNDLHTLEGANAVQAVLDRAISAATESKQADSASDSGGTPNDLRCSGAPDVAPEQCLNARGVSHMLEESGLASDSEATYIEVAGDGPSRAVTLEDLLAYLPSHLYIYRKTRDLWPAASVNAVIHPLKDGNGVTVKPSFWLDNNQQVHQMTWAPGMPELILDRLSLDGDWMEAIGSRCFNLYIPPKVSPGDANAAGPWIEHVHRVFPADAEASHIIKWLAHRVQKPGEKLNHALVIGGEQGIGKDTIFDPISHAVGSSNFNDVSPTQLLGRFNPFLKSVILRVSEARDLGDVNRYQFYEHMKVLAAAPPNLILCDEKNRPEHYVVNVCGVLITTNHKTNGIYLPADDRRHFVAWSPLTKDQIPDGYFRQLYSWYERGGIGHVAAYLRNVDLQHFDPKAPPPKTEAFWSIVIANRAPQDEELADALDFLERPDAITLESLAENPGIAPEFRQWILDPRNRRSIPHRLEEAGYVRVSNNNREDRLWLINKKRQAIYTLKTLSERGRQLAATDLVAKRSPGW